MITKKETEQLLKELSFEICDENSKNVILRVRPKMVDERISIELDLRIGITRPLSEAQEFKYDKRIFAANGAIEMLGDVENHMKGLKVLIKKQIGKWYHVKNLKIGKDD